MGLPALEADYLFVGPLIQARLQAELPGLPVDVCERAEQVLAADKRVRVAMVMWAGDLFTSRADRAAAQAFRQRWLVCLGLNNVGAQGDARHMAAGPLLSQLHRALAGWKPEGCPNPLARASSAMAPTFTATKAIYPLGFEIPLSL